MVQSRIRGWLRSAGRMTAITAATVVTAGLLMPLAGAGTALARPPAPATSAPQSSGTPAPARPGTDKPSGLPSLSAVPPDVRRQRAAMQAASERATRTGKPVTVAALTTPTQIVTARPGGGFTLSANVSPVRADDDGTWKPVDLRLSRGADGRITPATTAYGTVSFSPGGTGPLAVTASDGTTVAVSWPAPLPAPAVSGTTATYQDVYPGGDLEVSATSSGGFSDVLVVSSAAAARNPALSRLDLPVKVTGGTLATAGGGAQAVRPARGSMALQIGDPVMWDSRQVPASVPAAAGRPAARVNADPSTAAQPGMAARVAPFGTAVSRGSLVLTPDHGMLASPKTAYPVYIDPSFTWHDKTGGTPAFDQTKQGSPCNGVPEYDSTSSANDSGQLGAGYNGFAGGCDGDYHSYYQWVIPHVIWGATINPSTTVVNVTEVYSATCATTSYTVDLHQSGAIGSGTDWNNRPGATKGGVHATASFGNACSSNPSASFNVAAAVTAATSGHASTFTAYLSEDSSESSANEVPFKRFADNPDLQVQYNQKPSVPAPTALSAVTGADKAACTTSKPGPYIGKTIATNTPILKAKVSDPDGDALGVTFKYWVDGSSTTATSPEEDASSGGPPAQYSLPASFISSLASGSTVDWEVSAVTDGQATVGPSKTCYFTAETTAPSQPTIAPNATFPEDAEGAPAGTTATFSFSNTGTTATYFAYALDQQPALSGTPASEKATATNNTGSAQVTPLSPGPHVLWVSAVDAAGDPSSMQSYYFIAAYHAATTCATLSACFDNVAISPDTAQSQGAADGSGSFSATDLANAGWASGGTVTVDGARFALPSYGGAGQDDNVLASGQTITDSYAVPSAGTSALMFLATTTNASFSAPGGTDSLAAAPFVPAGTGVSGTYCFDSTDPSAYCPASGTINYTDGTTQQYDLAVPDWISGPADLAAVDLPHENRSSGGQISTSHPKIYPFAVPLQAGKTIASVTLPDVGTDLGGSNAGALHVFAMAPRAGTDRTTEANGTVATLASGHAWTGAWDNPTEGNYNFQGSNFSNQTFRIALKPSISGSSIRIKLDNALGSSPINIGGASVGIAAGSPSAAVSGSLHTITFGGNGAPTIPEGGMLYSDPLTFTVTANQYLVVSFWVTNSVPDMVEHSWANTAYTYLSAPGSGNQTGNTTGAPYSGTGTYQGWFTNLLTGVDVTTSGVPTLAVLGDGLIDAWQPNTSPNGESGLRLSDQLAAAEPTAPDPYGTIAEGIESNQVMTDDPQAYNGHVVGGPSALSRIDRDILDQPGISTVVLYEGLEDTLAGQTADNLDTNGYTTLLNYLQAQGINVIAVGQTPCDGYTGDGATANDPCTAAADAQRTTANAWLSSGPDSMNPWSVPSLFYLDPDATLGVTDSDGLTGLSSGSAIIDKVNLSNPGYGALASAILGPQNTWLLNDGTGSVTASDSAANTPNPFELSSAGPTADATLSAAGATWATDASRGTVLSLDGAAGDAETSGPVLITSGSYSVSAWAYPTQNTAYATIASQDGTTDSGFKLRISSAGKWAFAIPESDATNATEATATGPAVILNTWTHVAGVYNAVTHTASIYINGSLASTTSVPSITWSAGGNFTIGRTLSNGAATNYWKGSLSDVQAWNYAVPPDEVTTLYGQPPAGAYAPVTPVRILDTRSATGLNDGITGPVGSNAAITVPIVGNANTTDIPAGTSGVTAADVSITITGQTAGGNLIGYADGTPRPVTSILNYPATGNISNSAIVPVGSDGDIDLYNASGGTVQVIVDLLGYFTTNFSGSAGYNASTAPANASTYTPLADPVRLFYTGNGTGSSFYSGTASNGQVAANTALTVTINGNTTNGAGLPSSGVTAVALNLEALPPSGDNGSIAAYPDGTTRGNESNLSFTGGATYSTTAIVPVGTDGKIDIYNASAASINIVGDLSGYFTTSTTGQHFHALGSTRILDTRQTSPIGSNQTLTVPTPAGIPVDNPTLALNFTVVGPQDNGHLTIYPASASVPGTSIINFTTTDTPIAALGLINTATSNSLAIDNAAAGTTSVILDISGYFS
jgi:Concanavalin A-like lectin/glucanases superfamily